MKIGKLIKQPTGYTVFIPDKFPIITSKCRSLHTIFEQYFSKSLEV